MKRGSAADFLVRTVLDGAFRELAIANPQRAFEGYELSEEEKDIRVMCEQSAIPKALVDIAVSDPDKLDELEKQAEG